MLTFKGFEIVNRYPLNEEELHVLYACEWMVYNKSTIRVTAEKWDYSATTFWRRIHKECKELSPDLYKRVCHQMRVNLERRH